MASRSTRNGGGARRRSSALRSPSPLQGSMAGTRGRRSAVADEDSDDSGASSDEVMVLFRTSLHNTVCDVFSSQEGWQETRSDTDWDINWADVGWIRDFYDHIRFEEHQRVNHFRNHYELTRKDLMAKNLKRMRKHLAKHESIAESEKYNFFPTTYVLPQEYGLFLESFKKNAGSTWIMKPIGKAQGKGIFLFNKLSQISDWRKDHNWKKDAPQAETYVVQKYVERPYLIGGKKFDLRLYALVTSFSPLVVWVHKTGFARFSNTRYSDAKGDISNSFMHLTNVAIQKTAKDYNKEQGCKLSVHALRVFLMSRHGRAATEKCFLEMQKLIVRSLLSVQKVMINDRHSFELYGFDILFDQDLKSWLIEVNASPALSASNADDYELKYGLVQDLVDVVDLEGNLTGEERQIGGFDLVYHGGSVAHNRYNIGSVYRSEPAIAARRKKYINGSKRRSPKKSK